MKTIEILHASPRQNLTIHTKPNDDILGYVIAVDQWKGTKSIFGNWFGSEAEKRAGISFQLDPADGYDVVIKATVRSSGTPQIGVTLQLDGESLSDGTADFPCEEGPVVTRDWNIFVH